MRNHDDEVIIEVLDDFDSNATTEENDQIINDVNSDVSESDDASNVIPNDILRDEERIIEMRDIEMLEDFHSDATTEEID